MKGGNQLNIVISPNIKRFHQIPPISVTANDTQRLSLAVNSTFWVGKMFVVSLLIGAETLIHRLENRSRFIRYRIQLPLHALCLPLCLALPSVGGKVMNHLAISCRPLYTLQRSHHSDPFLRVSRMALRASLPFTMRGKFQVNLSINLEH